MFGWVFHVGFPATFACFRFVFVAGAYFICLELSAWAASSAPWCQVRETWHQISRFFFKAGFHGDFTSEIWGFLCSINELTNGWFRMILPQEPSGMILPIFAENQRPFFLETTVEIYLSRLTVRKSPIDWPNLRFIKHGVLEKPWYGTLWDRDWDGKLLFPCRFPRIFSDDVKLVWSPVVSVSYRT